MSAFCVFGISKSICRKAAEKKIEPGRMNITEWAIKRDKLAEAMFLESLRKVQISPKFDAPQFCEDWINSAKSEVRDCIIMCRGEKVDKHGGPVIKAGQPVMTWVEYSATRSLSFGPLSDQEQS